MEKLEKRLLRLIATDRIHRPISSMSGKLKRIQPKIAREVDLSSYGGRYSGERAYAEFVMEDKMKARGMKEGIEVFSSRYPRYGKILRGIIAEERLKRESHLYFGLKESKRLTADDYLAVMTDLGFSSGLAKKLYPELMEISRRMARKRQETTRRILVG